MNHNYNIAKSLSQQNKHPRAYTKMCVKQMHEIGMECWRTEDMCDIGPD